VTLLQKKLLIIQESKGKVSFAQAVTVTKIILEEAPSLEVLQDLLQLLDFQQEVAFQLEVDLLELLKIVLFLIVTKIMVK